MATDTRHEVRITNSNLVFRCRETETVLAALERAVGRDRMVGCRGGACGLCRIRVDSGNYESLPMSSDHVDAREKAAGLALACRIYPRGDLTCSYLGLKP